MIARPRISQNEWKTAEKGAFEVGNFALFCCPARDGGGRGPRLQVLEVARLAGLPVEPRGRLAALARRAARRPRVPRPQRVREHARQQTQVELPGLRRVQVAVGGRLPVEPLERRHLRRRKRRLRAGRRLRAARARRRRERRFRAARARAPRARTRRRAMPSSSADGAAETPRYCARRRRAAAAGCHASAQEHQVKTMAHPRATAAASLRAMVRVISWRPESPHGAVSMPGIAPALSARVDHLPTGGACNLDRLMKSERIDASSR